MNVLNLKLVAVDGGANRLQRLKMTQTFLLGIWTLSIVWIIYQSTQIIHIKEQDSTDFDKSLRTFTEQTYLQ